MTTVKLYQGNGRVVLLPAVLATCHNCGGLNPAQCGHCDALGHVKVLNILECTNEQVSQYREQQRKTAEYIISYLHIHKTPAETVNNQDKPLASPYTPRCNAQE